MNDARLVEMRRLVGRNTARTNDTPQVNATEPRRAK
jgi:hypothetical protein